MPGGTGAMAFTDCYKHMECLGWNEVTEFSGLMDIILYLPVQPQLVYTNKTGDYLFYLFICSSMDGQTARPNQLKFGRYM